MTKVEKPKSRQILLLPSYWVCIFDILITIGNQSKQYWNGDLSMANEGNPIGFFL